MVIDVNMYTKNKKWIKMKMETIVNKENEIIFLRSFFVGSCHVLNDNYCCMRCHHQSTLYQINTSQIDNNNIYLLKFKNHFWW